MPVPYTGGVEAQQVRVVVETRRGRPRVRALVAFDVAVARVVSRRAGAEPVRATRPLPFPPRSRRHSFISARVRQADEAKLKKFEDYAANGGGGKEAQELLAEMRDHTEKLAKLRKHEDPRMSFNTPEFKEFSRKFTENFKRNFGKPIEWGMVKKYQWSEPQLQRLDVPVDPDGNPWPLDDAGKPILKE